VAGSVVEYQTCISVFRLTSPLQATLSTLLTCCVLRPSHLPLSGLEKLVACPVWAKGWRPVVTDQGDGTSVI